jgi:hypothetical protein
MIHKSVYCNICVYTINVIKVIGNSGLMSIPLEKSVSVIGSHIFPDVTKVSIRTPYLKHNSSSVFISLLN